MRNFKDVQVICSQCKSSFLVKSSVVWRTKLCPACRVEKKREQVRQYGKDRLKSSHPCVDCGTLIYGHKGETLRCRRCWLKYIKQFPKLAEHQFMNTYGYIFVNAPLHQKKYGRRNNYIAEHRLVMEQTLNRPLKPTEIVHHLDGIKHHNHPRNLIITDRSNHEWDTILQALQKRIRNLEAQLSQQRF